MSTNITPLDCVLLEIPPRQARIVMLMQASPEDEWSAKTLADHFGWSLGATAYHVRALAGDGWFRKPRTARVRGAMQSWYRLDLRNLAQRRSAAGALEADDAARRRDTRQLAAA